MQKLQWFKADLHIHSVLSPCGDLEMSPHNVISRAIEEHLNIIAITDHNSLLNCETYQQIASQNNITLIFGTEIQTSEEIHIIALFDSPTNALKFNDILYKALLPIKNDPDYFGDQVIIDTDENIIGFEEKALLNSVIWTLEETIEYIENFQGFFFPAHFHSPSFSLLSQLGIFPSYIDFIALGITAKSDKKQIQISNKLLDNIAFIRNSDAHYLKDIGSGFTEFYLAEPTVTEIRKACLNIDGRKLKS